jgi:hypothetical protein
MSDFSVLDFCSGADLGPSENETFMLLKHDQEELRKVKVPEELAAAICKHCKCRDTKWCTMYPKESV